MLTSLTPYQLLTETTRLVGNDLNRGWKLNSTSSELLFEPNALRANITVDSGETVDCKIPISGRIRISATGQLELGIRSTDEDITTRLLAFGALKELLAPGILDQPGIQTSAQGNFTELSFPIREATVLQQIESGLVTFGLIGEIQAKIIDTYLTGRGTINMNLPKVTRGEEKVPINPFLAIEHADTAITLLESILRDPRDDNAIPGLQTLLDKLGNGAIDLPLEQRALMLKSWEEMTTAFDIQDLEQITEIVAGYNSRSQALKVRACYSDNA